MQWKIMVIGPSGVFFSGPKHLVKSPEEAQSFKDIDFLLDRVQAIMTLKLDGVTQVRLISEVFARDGGG